MLVQRFDPATALESIRARGVTVIPGAPAMWVAFAHFDEAPADAFATVRLALSGRGEAAGRACPSGSRERFGLAHRRGLRAHRGVAGRHVVGRACGRGSARSAGCSTAIELRVVDDDGDDALVGDAGEIWVRGPNVFAGYLDDPEATARVLTADGWLRTGDIAVIDDDGWLYLVDRAKDLIIVSGFNVFPAEVEEVLAAHPDVAEVGVIGVPHPHTGEAVKAFVVLEPGADARRGRAHRATPATTSPGTSARASSLFVDELPRTATGKLVRRELVDPEA